MKQIRVLSSKDAWFMFFRRAEVMQEISSEKATPFFILLWGRPASSSFEKQVAQNSNLEGACLTVIICRSIPRSRACAQTLTRLRIECHRCVKRKNHWNLTGGRLLLCLEGNSVNCLVFFFRLPLPLVRGYGLLPSEISRESVKAQSLSLNKVTAFHHPFVCLHCPNFPSGERTVIKSPFKKRVQNQCFRLVQGWQFIKDSIILKILIVFYHSHLINLCIST